MLLKRCRLVLNEVDELLPFSAVLADEVIEREHLRAAGGGAITGNRADIVDLTVMLSKQH